MIEPDYNPHAPVVEAGEDELVDDLVERVASLFGSSTRESILSAAREYTLEWVEAAVEKCEDMPQKPYSWGYVLGMLKNFRDEKARVRSARAAAMATSAHDSMVNFNPGIGSKDVEPTSPEAADLLRSLIGGKKKAIPHPAHEKTAAGSVAKQPPRPAEGSAQAFLDYSVNQCSRSISERQGPAHRARRESNPPAPDRPGASVVVDTAKPVPT